MGSVQMGSVHVNAITFGRWITLIGYFGLLTVLMSWFTWLAPPKDVPRVVPLVLLVVPLLFPLRGLLHGKRYTHQWMMFFCLFYFCVGVDAWFNPGSGGPIIGMLVTLFSLLLFIGCVVYARYLVPKKKKVSGNESTTADQ